MKTLASGRLYDNFVTQNPFGENMFCFSKHKKKNDPCFTVGFYFCNFVCFLVRTDTPVRSNQLERQRF